MTEPRKLEESEIRLRDKLSAVFIRFAISVIGGDGYVQPFIEEVISVIRKDGYVDVQPTVLRDRLTYLDEITSSGLPSVDEMVMQDATVHLEKLSDHDFMLIASNKTHYWHLVIFSRSSRAKIEAHLYEDNSQELAK